jgi:hypothetical protein
VLSSVKDLFDPNQGIHLFYKMKSNKLARAVDDSGMIEKTLLQVDTLADWVERRLVTSGLMASVVATWLTAGYLLSGSQGTAAEVDAIGTPAPLGFADIVERVKPTVVGIRVKIEGVTQSGEEQQKSPFPPGSPFDRYLRQFGIPHPDSSVSKGMAMGSGFLFPAMVMWLPTIMSSPMERIPRL